MPDSVILTSELMAFFKVKTTNYECKWITDMMVSFLPTLSTRMESVRCRRTSNLLHSYILLLLTDCAKVRLQQQTADDQLEPSLHTHTLRSE